MFALCISIEIRPMRSFIRRMKNNSQKMKMQEERLRLEEFEAKIMNERRQSKGHCQLKTLRGILSCERCGSCARLGRGHFPPDRE